MTVKLMPVGTPTVNDRVYPLDVVEAMIAGAQERISRGAFFMHVLAEPHADPSMSTVVGVVSRLYVSSGFLWCDYDMLPDRLIPTGSEFTISCVGHTTASQEVYDAALSHVMAVEPGYFNNLVSSRP